MDKPSLHDIAAMPYPASVNAMRKHYNPEWGRPVPEGGERRTFEVELDIEYTGSDTHWIKVEAFTEEEAEELAQQELEDRRYYEDFEVMRAKVREVSQ